jgi:MATE family multidrug resistance protein
MSGRIREALKVSSPIIVSQLLMTASGFITSIMLSNVDSVTFAAGLLIAAINMAIVTVVFGVLFSCSALIGKVMGEGTRLERVGHLFGGASCTGLLIGIPVMVVLYNIRPLLLMAGQPEAIADLCHIYFRVYVWGLPAVALVSACMQFLLGTFQQGYVFLNSLCSLVILTLVSYALIFGAFGFPPMGIVGLAWASMATSWLSCIALLLFVALRKGNKAYAPWRFDRGQWLQSAREIVRVGIPISVQMGNEIGSFLVTTLMVGWISVAALEMQQVTTRYLMLLVIPLVGFSQAATIVISRQFGARNTDEVRSTGWFYTGLGLTYAFGILLLFLLFPKQLIGVFIHYTPEAEATFHTLSILLVVVAIGQIFDSVRNIITGALRGLLDSKYPMLVSILMIWGVGIPLAYFMGFTLDYGLIGMAIAHNLTMAIGAAVLFVRFQSKVRGLSQTDRMPSH